MQTLARALGGALQDESLTVVAAAADALMDVYCDERYDAVGCSRPVVAGAAAHHGDSVF